VLRAGEAGKSILFCSVPYRASAEPSTTAPTRPALAPRVDRKRPRPRTTGHTASEAGTEEGWPKVAGRELMALTAGHERKKQRERMSQGRTAKEVAASTGSPSIHK
jgi:hypothetical protein